MGKQFKVTQEAIGTAIQSDVNACAIAVDGSKALGGQIEVGLGAIYLGYRLMDTYFMEDELCQWTIDWDNDRSSVRPIEIELIQNFETGNRAIIVKG